MLRPSFAWKSPARPTGSHPLPEAGLPYANAARATTVRTLMANRAFVKCLPGRLWTFLHPPVRTGVRAGAAPHLLWGWTCAAGWGSVGPPGVLWGAIAVRCSAQDPTTQAEGTRMKTSTNRILTTHVGSIPRPESIKALLRARLSGQTIDAAQLAARVAEAVADVVRQQAEVGIDVISDGEMGKTSFLAYADTRLTGFVAMTADNTDVPSSNAGGSWARRLDTRREWRAFREYYQEYLPRAMPPATPPVVCQGPIAYTGQAVLQRELATFKAALHGVDVEEAFVPAIAPAMVGRGQNQ